LILLGQLVVGCTGYDEGTRSLEALDVDAYARFVQPYVGIRCASLDCHGDTARPLRIYAEDGLRLRHELRGEELSLEEHEINVQMFLGTAPDQSLDESWLLLKPLSPRAGGVSHEGRTVWDSRADAGYTCLADWLSAVPGQDLEDPCAEALAPWLPD